MLQIRNYTFWNFRSIRKYIYWWDFI